MITCPKCNTAVVVSDTIVNKGTNTKSAINSTDPCSETANHKTDDKIDAGPSLQQLFIRHGISLVVIVVLFRACVFVDEQYFPPSQRSARYHALSDLFAQAFAFLIFVWLGILIREFWKYFQKDR